ncbi:MAG: S26 family signal peptidase [Thermoplasmata archaeon]
MKLFVTPRNGLPMNKDRMKKTLIGIGKDVFVAFTIVCVVMLCLYAYCGIWPPMVVVESGSMQRFDDRSVVGVIDTGDMVFVKDIGGVDDIVTYVDGEATDYSKYGTYGDVIIYRPNGEKFRTLQNNETVAVIPIIHRAVVWLEINETLANPNFYGIDYANITFDVPSMGMYGSRDIISLTNYGYWKDDVAINLDGIMVYYEGRGKVPHGGYITMGDNNVPFYDQPNIGYYEPVLPDWIVGRAIGEIPWFGLIKLKVTGSPLYGVPRNSWTGLYATLFLVLVVPFMVDILAPRFVKWRKDRKSVGISDVGEPVMPENAGEAEKPGGGIETPPQVPDEPVADKGADAGIMPK